MVDETAFRKVLRSANPQPCTFGKAILAACCKCPLVEKHYVAERETIACADEAARAACFSLHEQLRHNSAFAIKQIHDDGPITHAQEMKLQCGGLQGLQRVVDGRDAVDDVYALVGAALVKFGNLEMLPYVQIVQSVASYKIRKRHGTG
jgi:hypothetical protein